MPDKHSCTISISSMAQGEQAAKQTRRSEDNDSSLLNSYQCKFSFDASTKISQRMYHIFAQNTDADVKLNLILLTQLTCGKASATVSSSFRIPSAVFSSLRTVVKREIKVPCTVVSCAIIMNY